MPFPTAGTQPVHYIDQPHLLAPCLQQLAQSNTLAFDLEFDNNRYGYGVTLCLVQVATPQACYVIDPLAGLDLAELYVLFEQPAIQKIVHAPGEDLRLLHSLGCYPKNLFDTEVAARLLNYEQSSLTALLRDKLQFQMDKKQQKSNWLRRPLSDEQVQYAADDVLWLHPLKALLEKEAEERGVLPYVQEEQELLSTTIHGNGTKTSFLKPADLLYLSPLEQYITNELLRYRDELARGMGKPAYQVIGEELVRDLVTGKIQAQDIPYETSVHPRYRNGRFATQLAQQLRRLKEAAEDQNLSDEPPGRPRLTPEQHAVIRQAAHDRDHLFAPIQQALVQRFGQHTTVLLLSNKMVNDIVKGAMPLRNLPRYRQQLIREIAGELGLDVGRYE
ncbi:ribonuclease D [Pseudocnuella soli]|uniref:ribonuclease D n=1 Tax=Pseudocnuella soli TaxID=2502779 RepID=UPI001045399D|nr:ribonuclease D [Pseudocnuella soli]